jgi:Ser/Thr protein kinase RdoA (MazF antagonist)
MSLAPLDLAAQDVLREYGITKWAPAANALAALGNRGGFSGARLWRLETDAGPFCLRLWPADGPTPARLAWIHQLMRAARDAGLSFVPAVFPTSQGQTWVARGGRLWELTSWMPGKADFHGFPSPARLQAACSSLARLHSAWASVSQIDRCPAIARRLERAQEWSNWVQSGWQPAFEQTQDASVKLWAERAWELLSDGMDSISSALVAWADRSFALQPCLCDVWHDHLLFEGDTLTGLIDYGGVKVDHVAVDLARLLGSMAGDDAGLRALGLRAYSQVRSLSWEEDALVTILDRTGTLIGLATWLRWLYREKKAFENMPDVAQRLKELVSRAERPNHEIQ